MGRGRYGGAGGRGGVRSHYGVTTGDWCEGREISEKFACLIQDLPTRNLPMFQKKYVAGPNVEPTPNGGRGREGRGLEPLQPTEIRRARAELALEQRREGGQG